MKILSFGSMNVDYVYKVAEFVKPGETKTVTSLQTNAGGKGLNQAIALSKAGLDVYQAGMLGDEGIFLREMLQKYNVDTKMIKTTHDKNGHAIIQVDDSGENCILVYPGTNHSLTKEFIDEVLSQFDKDDVVITQNETNLISYLFDRANAKGMRIAFNPSPFTQEIMNYPLDKVTWLFINETEGASITGAAEPNEIIQSIAHNYPQMKIILTLGAAGSMYYENGKIEKCDAIKVNPVDTTAAGDTFSGYFLRGILAPINGVSALKLATAASSIAIMRQGAAVSIPSFDEVIKNVEE